MEKISNKYACIIRIICYILIPICALAILQSIISIIFFQEENTNILKDKDSYFETEQFTNLYKQSIYSNIKNSYSNTELGKVVDISNLYGITQMNAEGANIYYKTYLENKNFKFLIIDNKTNIAFTNLEQTMRTDSIQKIKEELSNYSYYWNYQNGNINTNIEKLSLENIKYKDQYKVIEEEYDCTIYTAIQEDITYHDDYYNLKSIYDIVPKNEDLAIANLVLSIILIILSLILITIYSGRKKGEKQIHLNLIDKIPLEIIAIFDLVFLSILICLSVEISYNINIVTIIAYFCIAILVYIIGMVSYESFVKRIKTSTLFKNTILYKIYKFIKKEIKNIFNNLKISVKLGIVLATIIILTIIFTNLGFKGIVLLIFMYVIAFKYCFRYIDEFLNIKEAIKQIYEGNTKIMLKEDEYEGVLKELCIYINDITGGFTNAIEKSLKSERMKTELITNVSHDIKTPLTSIINYVDLLKKEKMPNKKSEEYLDILDKKSQRLKRLTEDLVEASKASSGNIKLNMEKINVNELIKQVSGEFEDKLNENKLELILGLNLEEAIIMADSRYIYRIIENLYSNIVKYALPNSRVYVDVVQNKEDIQIELKNISKEKLNISADELMQRFVRGDTSRNTEGSGLGLSIARSLTELQKGSFEIYLDGDLFKIVIKFKKER